MKVKIYHLHDIESAIIGMVFIERHKKESPLSQSFPILSCEIPRGFVKIRDKSGIVVIFNNSESIDSKYAVFDCVFSRDILNEVNSDLKKWRRKKRMLNKIKKILSIRIF